MTNEEGLRFDETAHHLKLKEREPRLPLIKKVTATQKFGNFSAEGLARIQINPHQESETMLQKDKTKPLLGLIGGIVAAVATVLILVGLVLGYRYQSASIEGGWTSQTLSKQMKASLEASGEQGEVTNSLPQGEELITNIQTSMSVVQNKAQLTVSFDYNRKGLYQTYKSRVDDLKKQYGTNFAQVFDSYSLSEEDYYKQFDETIQKELPKSYRYDSKTGRVTTVAFKGNVNRWDQTITVSQSGDTDGFKEGDVLDYQLKGSHFVIQAHGDYGTIDFAKKK